MKRGRLETAAAVLLEVKANPLLAPSRITARAGLPYGVLRAIVAAGLVEFVELKGRKRRLQVTPEGEEFLQHFKICDQLFPEGSI